MARREYKEYVIACVQGPRNITAISGAVELTKENIERLASHVASKRPGRRYYVCTDTQPKQILYRWHVGEGFSHEEGWWINA